MIAENDQDLLTIRTSKQSEGPDVDVDELVAKARLAVSCARICHRCCRIGGPWSECVRSSNKNSSK